MLEWVVGRGCALAAMAEVVRASSNHTQSKEGDLLPWWEAANTSMRTFSPAFTDMTFDEVYAMAQGDDFGPFTAFGLNAIYDSGLRPDDEGLAVPYNPINLWMGLALGDLEKPNQFLGDAENIVKLADALHSQHKKLTSW